MARPRNRSARRRKGSSVPPGWIVVLVLIIVAVIAAVGLHFSQRPAPPPALPVTPQVEVKKKLPPRQEEAPVQERISAVPPPAKQRAVPPPPAKPGKPGTLALIIDDMGTSVSEVKRLMSIGVPLTFSVIPGLRQSKETAEAAFGNGYEVMIHMPMEPKGYPQQRMEKNGLLTSYGDDEIRQRVRGYLGGVPHADGANNHMGSRFTEVREKMRPALSVLKENGLFFIDSRTSPQSVGLDLAREMGMKAGVRSVFLDNVQEVGAIRAQLEQAADAARKKGSAIAICHPHKATMEALAAALPELQSRGITFVAVRELVR